MKQRRVILTPEATDDLEAIHRYIAEATGSAVADHYLGRLKKYVKGFDLASERGTLRNDLRPGLRYIGFERRVTITFAVFEDHVEILNFFWGDQNWEEKV